MTPIEAIQMYYIDSRIGMACLLVAAAIEVAQDRPFGGRDAAMAIWFAIPPVAEAWVIGFALYTTWKERL